MGYKQKVLYYAKKHGMAINWCGEAGRNFEVTCEAPNGKHFEDQGALHELVTSTWDDGESPDEIWRDIYERMTTFEVVSCNEDCEWWGDPD